MNKLYTVVREIFACKIFRLLIFRIVYFLSHEPSEKFSTVNITLSTKYICRRKYFACLIFGGSAHRRTFFNGENFPNYGSSQQQQKGLLNAEYLQAELLNKNLVLLVVSQC